jgi:hypothetical protein
MEKLDLTPTFAQSISALIYMRAFFESSVLSWIECRMASCRQIERTRMPAILIHFPYASRILAWIFAMPAIQRS